MAKTWLYGIFGDGSGSTTIDGTTSVSQVLPVTGGTDKVTKTVRGDASGTLNVAREDLPANWKTETLVTGRTLIALVDGDRVLFAGYLNKINNNLNGSITLVVNGLKEYINRQQVNDTYGSTETNPDSATVFTGLGWTGLLQNIVRKCFSMDGVPNGARPANVLGDFIGRTDDTETKTLTSKHSGFETFGNILNTITDNLSRYGVEVLYVPRWENVATKTRIVWDVVTGDDFTKETAHLYESETVELDASQVVNGFSSLSDLSLTYSVEDKASRYTAQSRYGDKDIGVEADITTKIRTDTGMPRFDIAYNPEAMLDLTEMDERLDAYLQSQPESSAATLNILEDWGSEWAERLGYTITLKKTIDEATAETFSMTVRCTSVSFTAGTSRVEITIEQMKPRFPRKKDKQTKPIQAINETPQSFNPMANVFAERKFPLNKTMSIWTSNTPQPTETDANTKWWAAGRGDAGQLATGTKANAGAHTPVRMGEIPAGMDLADIQGSYGITADGKVYGWGELSGTYGITSMYGTDGLVKNGTVPHVAAWFGSKPIKKVASPMYGNTVIALLADGSEIIQIHLGSDAKLYDYTWSNPPAPIIDIALKDDAVYAVLNDGTLWAKGNSVFLGIGSTVPGYIENWTRCQQTNGAELSNIKEVQVVFTSTQDTMGNFYFYGFVAAVSNFGALYRIAMTTDLDGDTHLDPWFKVALTSGVDKVQITPTGIYYLDGVWLKYRSGQELKDDGDAVVEWSQDAGEYKRWTDFAVGLGTLGFNGADTVMGIDDTGQVWAKGENKYGELGTGTQDKRDSFTLIDMGGTATKVRAFENRTFIKLQ